MLLVLYVFVITGLLFREIYNGCKCFDINVLPVFGAKIFLI